MRTFLMLILLVTAMAPTPVGESCAGGSCDPGGAYYDACEVVGLQMWDTCRAAGGSKAQCEADAQLAQNNCMRDFGCPPIIF